VVAVAAIDSGASFGAAATSVERERGRFTVS
jgi:hypothetical protein